MLKGGDHGWEPSTTLWELWDADRQGPSMNSRNHIMFGSVGAWFYRKLLGVTPLTPGYHTISIRPSGVGHPSLPHASTNVATPRGDVRLRVEANSTFLALHVSVPCGATAVVALRIPRAISTLVGSKRFDFGDNARVTEGGRVVWCMHKFVAGVEGVSTGKLSADGTHVELDVASGTYEFRVTRSVHC